MSELTPTQVASIGLLASAGTPTCQVSTNIPLFACTNEDARLVDITVPPKLIRLLDALVVYGSRSFESLNGVKTSQLTRPFWKQCSTVCYCNGPVDEQTTLSLFEHFVTRWKISFVDGVFYYGRADDTPKQVSSVLFPTTVSTFDKFTACFEQNNTLIFAVETSGSIELRRLQAGILTTLTFSGTSPVLFLNSELQPNLGEQDVVCYYLLNGDLCGRWQRDNFATEYVLVEDLDVTELSATYADVSTNEPREYLFCLKDCATRCLITELYPIWAQERIGATVQIEPGDTVFQIIAIPSESDSFSTASVTVGDGDALLTVLTLTGESDSFSSSAGVIDNGDVALVVVALSTETDFMSSAASVVDDADSVNSIINGGSYSENVNNQVSVNDTGSCEYE